MKVYFSGLSWDETLKANGVNCILESYANIRQSPARIEKLQNVLCFGDIMIDSGAWSVDTGRFTVTVEQYSNWLLLELQKYPNITTYVNLDDIRSHEVTRNNQEYMEAQGLKPMPVFHYGEPVEALDAMCEKAKYVGLGGVAARKLQAATIKIWWEFVKERHPGNDFHIFGIGQLNPLVKYPPYSVDTTTWLSARFGSLLCLLKGIPASIEIPQLSSNPNEDGAKIYLTWEEAFNNNIRALLDWQDWQWTKYVKEESGSRPRLL